MRLIHRFLLAAVLAVAAISPAHASFHLWALSELYSNADGSVQFLEVTAITSAQEFVQGHALTSSSGGVTHTFTVPRDLPGDSGGRKMLFGTQGFAALGVVTPDFVVPNGFFFPGGGTISWAEGSDVWDHGPLPTNGDDSLLRGGSTASNSPQNFARQTGHVSGTPVSTTSLNVQGLWWRSPAGSESGWGVNLTQQGDILFATWFTYDTDGTGLWLVMSNGAKTGTDTYTGQLFRTTGPAFSAPFNSAPVTVTAVGSATFTFTDENNGTFSYTVNGISQSKPITRQVFESPVPTCSEGGTPGSTPIFQDLWWRSPAGSESGWGLNVTHQGSKLFATWFTYDASNKGLWLVASELKLTAPSTFTGELFRTTGPTFSANPWNPAQVTVTQVGSATLTFTDSNNGTFAYTVNGVSQTKPITRQVFSTPTTVCR